MQKGCQRLPSLLHGASGTGCDCKPLHSLNCEMNSGRGARATTIFFDTMSQHLASLKQCFVYRDGAPTNYIEINKGRSQGIKLNKAWKESYFVCISVIKLNLSMYLSSFLSFLFLASFFG